MVNNRLTIKGTNQDGAKYTVVLTIAGNTWTKTEPRSASDVFKTATGLWSRAVNITTLFRADNKTKVGTFNPLIPESAKVGDSGTGISSETASTLDWTVASA